MASEQSFRDAVFLGIDLVRERTRFEEYTSNLLQTQEQHRSEGGRGGKDNRGPRKPRPAARKPTENDTKERPDTTEEKTE